jgi:hypothetical protein
MEYFFGFFSGVLLLYVWYLRSGIHSRVKAVSLVSVLSHRLIHSLNADLRKAAGTKRTQRDLLLLVEACVALLEEHAELLTRDTWFLVYEFFYLLKEDAFVKERRSLADRIEALHIRIR